MKTKYEITKELLTRYDEYERKKSKRMSFLSGMAMTLVGALVMLSIIVLPPFLKKSGSENPSSTLEQTTDNENNDPEELKKPPMVARYNRINCYYIEIIDQTYEGQSTYLGLGYCDSRDALGRIYMSFTLPENVKGRTEFKKGDWLAVYSTGELTTVDIQYSTDSTDSYSQAYNASQLTGIVYAVEIEFKDGDEIPVRKDGGLMPIFFTGKYVGGLIEAVTPVGDFIKVGDRFDFHSPNYDIDKQAAEGDGLLLLCKGMIAECDPPIITVIYAAKIDEKTDTDEGVCATLTTEYGAEGCYIYISLENGIFGMSASMSHSFAIIGAFERADDDLLLYPKNSSEELYILHREDGHFVSESEEKVMGLTKGLVFTADNDEFWDALLDWSPPDDTAAAETMKPDDTVSAETERPDDTEPAEAGVYEFPEDVRQKLYDALIAPEFEWVEAIPECAWSWEFKAESPEGEISDLRLCACKALTDYTDRRSRKLTDDEWEWVMDMIREYSGSELAKVIYVGDSFETYSEIADALKNSFSDLLENYDIPKDLIKASDGNEVFVIIPSKSCEKVTINAFDESDAPIIMEELFCSYTPEPFMVKCNFSDMVCDTVITIETDGRQYAFTVSSSNRDGDADIEFPFENRRGTSEITGSVAVIYK